MAYPGHPRGPLATQKYRSYLRRYKRSAEINLGTTKYRKHLKWDDRNGNKGEFCAEEGEIINTSVIRPRITWDTTSQHILLNPNNYSYSIVDEGVECSICTVQYYYTSEQFLENENNWWYPFRNGYGGENVRASVYGIGLYLGSNYRPDRVWIDCMGSPTSTCFRQQVASGGVPYGWRFSSAIITNITYSETSKKIKIIDGGEEFVYDILNENSVQVQEKFKYTITDTIKTEIHMIEVIDPTEIKTDKGIEWVHGRYLIKSDGNCNPSSFTCTCPDFTQEEKEGQHWLDSSLQPAPGTTRSWAGSEAGPFNPCKHIMAAKRLLEIPQSYGGYP